MITSNTKESVCVCVCETERESVLKKTTGGRLWGCNWGGTGLGYFWSMCCFGPTAEHVPVQGQVMMSVPAEMTRCRVWWSTSVLTFSLNTYSTTQSLQCMCVCVCVFVSASLSFVSHRNFKPLKKSHGVLHSVIVWLAQAITKGNWVS